MHVPRRCRPVCLLVLAAATSLTPGCGVTAVTLPTEPRVSGELGEHYEATRLRLLDDYEPWRGPREARVRRNGRAAASVPSEQGWCYAYFAVAEASLLDLDMEVRNADGDVLGRDEMFDATPFVQYCADDAGEVTVQVRAARGRGDVAIGALRKPD